MKTYIDIIAANLVTNKKRLLRKIEIDTNKIKAGLTPKQKAIFARIVERLELKGEELSDAQEEAILYLALEHNGEFVDRESVEGLVDGYRRKKRIEKRDIKGAALLFEILEVLKKLKLEKLKSRLFDFIVWLVIYQDCFLHWDGCNWIGFFYASIDDMMATYAQILGVSADEVFNTIERLKKRDAIVEHRGSITLDFPFCCLGMLEDKMLRKELKDDEEIDEDIAFERGICFIPDLISAKVI